MTDADTAAAIKEVKEKYDYLLDPHGAVGYTAVKRHIEKTGDTNTPYVFLETAHPAKFSEVIHEILGVNPEIPETLQEYLNKEKVSIPMKPVYEELKAYLKTRKNK